MLKLVVNFKYFLLLSFLTVTEFYNLGHIQGWINSKDVIFSDRTTLRSDFYVD